MAASPRPLLALRGARPPGAFVAALAMGALPLRAGADPVLTPAVTALWTDGVEVLLATESSIEHRRQSRWRTVPWPHRPCAMGHLPDGAPLAPERRTQAETVRAIDGRSPRIAVGGCTLAGPGGHRSRGFVLEEVDGRWQRRLDGPAELLALARHQDEVYAAGLDGHLYGRTRDGAWRPMPTDAALPRCEGAGGNFLGARIQALATGPQGQLVIGGRCDADPKSGFVALRRGPSFAPLGRLPRGVSSLWTQGEVVYAGTEDGAIYYSGPGHHVRQAWRRVRSGDGRGPITAIRGGSLRRLLFISERDLFVADLAGIRALGAARPDHLFWRDAEPHRGRIRALRSDGALVHLAWPTAAQQAGR